MSFILNCDSEPRVYSDETTLPNYSFIYKRRAYITLDVNYLSYLKHLVSTAVIDTKSKTTSMQSSFETCRTQVRNFLGKGFLRNPRRRLEDSCEMHLASLAPPVTLLKPIILVLAASWLHKDAIGVQTRGVRGVNSGSRKS